MTVCKNCHQLFDPALVPAEGDRFAEDYLCSWHPGELEDTGNTGPRGDYADLYKWTCCGKTRVGAIIRGRDYPPRRSPGCTVGHHLPDPVLRLAPELAGELRSLQERLRELEALELKPGREPGVFVSYSHRDSAFVDQLTSRLTTDKIDFWRDDKDLFVGDVIDKALSGGIQTCRLFLVVLSPASVKSHWVERELDEASHEAAEGNKVILPVVTGGLPPKDMPARIRRFKCADLSADFEGGYIDLRRAVLHHMRVGARAAQQ